MNPNPPPSQPEPEADCKPSGPRFVYIAGPYTSGDPVLNVRAAVAAGQQVLDAGFIPFVPHLYHLWHTIHPGHYEQWMRLDKAWLERCDAIIRLPGVSAGADREVAWARELGIPVYESVHAFLAAHGREYRALLVE